MLAGQGSESEDVIPVLYLYKGIKCLNNMKATGSQNDSSLYSQYTEMIDNSYKGKSKTEKKHSWIQRRD